MENIGTHGISGCEIQRKRNTSIHGRKGGYGPTGSLPRNKKHRMGSLDGGEPETLSVWGRGYRPKYAEFSTGEDQKLPHRKGEEVGVSEEASSLQSKLSLYGRMEE